MAEYVSQKEVLEKLNISRTTLYRMIKEGLPCKEVGRSKLFIIGDVEAFMEARKNDTVQQLEIGKEYSNAEIVEIFKVGMMGGMRRSHSKNALVLISFHDGIERIYNDYWKDDILYYTGHGQSGDQELGGQNKTLAESDSNGITVYLFEMYYSQRYQYRGIVKLAAKPFTETECDVDGIERKVWKFPLKLVNTSEYMDIVTVDEQEAHLSKQVVENLGSALTLFASASKMVLSGSEVTVKAKKTQTNPVIGEYARLRADGHCELCGQEAPFIYRGRPYLELAHLIPLSENGKDSISNVAALCSNCHRKLDLLRNNADMEILKKNMQANEKRLRNNLEGKE